MPTLRSLVRGSRSCPHSQGKVLPTDKAVSLAMVPCGLECASTSQYSTFLMRDTWVPNQHNNDQSETSTSGRRDAAAKSSSLPNVTVALQGNTRVSLGKPKEFLFGVDYLEPNKITMAKLSKYCAEYLIPDSVKWRILRPTESLSNPKDGEVAFFTDILTLGIGLSLQPTVQRILAHLGHASGQYNPNF